jgi:indolepyruvate ferredoxin oxidoreductase alpha subunit
VRTAGAYARKAIRAALKGALADAAQGLYTTLVINDGQCVQMVPPSTQRVLVDAQACTRCAACLVCPGLAANAAGLPEVTNLCSGCGGMSPACVQMCPYDALHPVDRAALGLPAAPQHPDPGKPWEAATPTAAPQPAYPRRLALAIRGVGGQGNLFFGHVLSQLAFLAGYADQNIIKGETHGMAQMGGPVLSTFACGQVHSPTPLPGTLDVLIAMEQSEVLRPGFLELLKPGGTILMAQTRLLPPGLPEGLYPSPAQIAQSLADCHVVAVDALGIAQSLGDTSGRTANVVMMGALSKLPPLDVFPETLWLQALYKANSRPAVWAANAAAFRAGRG